MSFKSKRIDQVHVQIESDETDSNLIFKVKSWDADDVSLTVPVIGRC